MFGRNDYPRFLMPEQNIESCPDKTAQNLEKRSFKETFKILSRSIRDTGTLGSYFGKKWSGEISEIL